MARVVTISASYGAGGSVVAPDVASRLGFPFFDRAVPAGGPVLGPEDVVVQPEDAGPEGAAEEERTEGRLARMLARFAAVPDPLALSPAGEVTRFRDDALREEAESRVRAFSRSDGVILGWGSTIVVEDAFHVRLDGPVGARVRQGMRIENRSEPDARGRLEHTDKTRELYINRMYGRDWRDLMLYQLVLDSTALSLEGCAEVIVQAAREFWSGVRPG